MIDYVQTGKEVGLGQSSILHRSHVWHLSYSFGNRCYMSEKYEEKRNPYVGAFFITGFIIGTVMLIYGLSGLL